MHTIRNLVLTIALVVAAVIGIVFLGSDYRLKRRYSVGASPVPERCDSASLARGGHLYHSTGCAMCHGPDGGGKLYLDAGPIGLAVAAQPA